MGQSKKTPSKAATVKAAAGKHANHKPIIKATVHAKASTKSKTQAEKPVAMAATAKPVPARKPAVAAKPIAKPVGGAQVPASKSHAPATRVKPAAAPTAKAVPAAPVRHAVSAAAMVAARAQQAHAVPARAMAAAVSNVAGTKITQPATPKDLAAKAAVAHQSISAQAAKKPISQRHGFKTNEWIVYPSHGVGRIVAIEEQEIAGMALELFVITFEKDKMTLRVPTGKSASVGMRKLADDGIVKRAMETLKGKARIKRTMWSRRAQEFETKINSGDLISIAEVVRDLFRADNQPEQSYSERQLYEAALDRMSREIAAIEKLDDRGASQRITEVLSKSAKGRRLAAEEAASNEAVKAA